MFPVCPRCYAPWNAEKTHCARGHARPQIDPSEVKEPERVVLNVDAEGNVEQTADTQKKAEPEVPTVNVDATVERMRNLISKGQAWVEQGKMLAEELENLF